MGLKIPRRILSQIESQAIREQPLECCGYLGASNGRISTAYPMTNADASPTHFTLKPEEQFAVVKQARSAGEEIVAVYHSHPETPARMSEEDLRLAYDTSVVYAIFSLLNGEFNAFRVEDHRVVATVPVEVIDE